MNLASHSPRKYAVLILLTVFCLVFSGISAFAQENLEETLSFSLSVEPASMTAPGIATVSARVSNAGTQAITTPLSLYDPDGKLVTSFSDGGSLMQLPSGENFLWQGQYDVKQNHLDEGKLVYTLRYNSQDAAGTLIEKNIPATAEIEYTGEKVELKVNRTITPEVIRRGKTATVIYDLINQGNVKLTNITIRENRLISTKTQKVTSLEPGESAQITFSRSNVTGDLSSSATVTYYKEGDRKIQQLTVASVDVPLAKPGLQYTLTSDKTQYSIGETAVLTLQIKNAGNITYSNVTVTDPILGEVFSNVQIAAGQTRELTKEVAVNETTTYQFTLKLEDNTGTTMEEKVPDLKVSAYAEGQMLRLNLTLTASSEAIYALPGDIRFDLTVTNDSNTTAKNIRIRHAQKDIYTIDELAPGQSMVVSRDFSLSQAGKYQFTATATDVQNNPVDFTSNALEIAYVVPTAAPTHEVVATVPPPVTHSPVPENFTSGNGQVKDILFILTLVFGALFGAAFVLVAISGIARARQRAKSNAAFDTFELAGARDYTAPADEARQPVETLAAEEESLEPVIHTTTEEMPHEKYLRKAEEAVEAVDTENETTQPQPANEDGAFSLKRESAANEPEVTDETASEVKEGETRSRRTKRHKADNEG